MPRISAKLIAGKIGKIVQRLDAVCTELDQHDRGEAFDPGDLFRDPQGLTAFRHLAVLLVEEGAGAVAKFWGDILVEAFDLGQFVDLGERDFLDR